MENLIFIYWCILPIWRKIPEIYLISWTTMATNLEWGISTLSPFCEGSLAKYQLSNFVVRGILSALQRSNRTDTGWLTKFIKFIEVHQKSWIFLMSKWGKSSIRRLPFKLLMQPYSGILTVRLFVSDYIRKYIILISDIFFNSRFSF